MYAAKVKLDNLCAIVDRNGLQISGKTEEITGLGDLEGKWKSFGWNVLNVREGNHVNDVYAALEEAKFRKGQPSIVIAETMKGLGSSVMQNKANWHHRVPTQEEYGQIMKDLEARRKETAHE